MPKLKRFQVVEILCRRGCGKRLATTTRAIFRGNQHIHDLLHGVCENCMTDEEKEMLDPRNTIKGVMASIR